MNAKIVKVLIISLLTIATISRFRPCISVGHCLDEYGHGHIDKCTDGVEEPYTYISYHGIAKTGEKVITFDLFNPLNNYCDDTILIMDYNTNTNTLSIR